MSADDQNDNTGLMPVQTRDQTSTLMGPEIVADDNNYYFKKKPPVQINDIIGLEKIGEKSGGTGGAGKLGGWYQDIHQNKIFIKQDVSAPIGELSERIQHAKNILEVIESQLSRLIDTERQDTIANVNFIIPDKTTVLPNNGEDIYVCSVGMSTVFPEQEEEQRENIDFLDLYNQYQAKFNNSLPSYEEVHDKLYKSPCIDLWEDAYLAYNFSPQFAKLRKEHGSLVEIPKSRPKMVGTLNSFPIMNVIKSDRYEGMADSIPMEVFFDNPDNHTANKLAILVWNNPHIKRIGSIDFAAGMKNYDGKLHFMEPKVKELIRYTPGLNPTYHTREYPEEILICDSAAQQYRKIGNFDPEALETRLAGILDEVDALYTLEPILELAYRCGAKLSNARDKSQVLEDIKAHLMACFISRQKECRELYIEMMLSLSFEKNKNGFEFKQDRLPHLENLIDSHIDYFAELIKTDNYIRFHKAEQQDEFSSDRLNFLVKQKVKERLYGIRLSLRSDSVFHRLFNSSKIERFSDDSGLIYILKTLFGYPNKGNPYNWGEWIGTAFGIVTFTKNLIKFIIEYIPEQLAELSGLIYENNKKDLQRNQSLLVDGITYFNMALTGALYMLGKSIRMITMRLTSPVESIKQAYHFGENYSVMAGIVFAGLSLMLTMNEASFLLLAGAPLLAAVASGLASFSVGAAVLSGLTSAMHFVLGIHAVASLVGAVTAAATTLEFGLLSTVPMLAACATFLILPMRSLVKSTIKMAWKSHKVDVPVPDYLEDDIAPLNDNGTTKKIGALLDLKETLQLHSEVYVADPNGLYKPLQDNLPEVQEKENQFKPPAAIAEAEENDEFENIFAFKK